MKIMFVTKAIIMVSRKRLKELAQSSLSGEERIDRERVEMGDGMKKESEEEGRSGGGSGVNWFSNQPTRYLILLIL